MNEGHHYYHYLLLLCRWAKGGVISRTGRCFSSALFFFDSGLDVFFVSFFYFYFYFYSILFYFFFMVVAAAAPPHAAHGGEGLAGLALGSCNPPRQPHTDMTTVSYGS